MTLLSQLECSEELGDAVRGQDMSLAVMIYKRAQAHGMAVKCLVEMGYFDELHRYARQVGFELDHDTLQQIAQASVGEHVGQGQVIESLDTRRNLTTPTTSVGGDDVDRETRGSMETVRESRSIELRIAWATVEQLRCLEFPALRDTLADIATIEGLRVRALALRGRDAAVFNDLLQQVCPISYQNPPDIESCTTVPYGYPGGRFPPSPAAKTSPGCLPCIGRTAQRLLVARCRCQLATLYWKRRRSIGVPWGVRRTESSGTANFGARQ
jgi:hypothetical protein